MSTGSEHRAPAVAWVVQHPGVAVTLVPLLYALVKVVRVSGFTRSTQLAILEESDALDVLIGTIVPLVPTAMLIALGVAFAATLRSKTIGTRLRVTTGGLIVGASGFLVLSLPLNRLLPTVGVICAFAVLVALVIPHETRAVKAVAVAVLATSIQVVAVDEMWLPTEAIVTTDGAGSVGYVLSNDAESIIWMHDDTRTIARVERETITEQWFCRKRSGSRSIIDYLTDRDPRSEIAPCPNGNDT